MKLIHWMGLGAALILTGCATTTASDAMVTPPSYIAAAQEAGASNVPDAELHLKYAKDQYAAGKAAIEDGDEEKGRRLFERAKVDAEVALELARLSESQEREQAARKQLEDIRKNNSDLVN